MAPADDLLHRLLGLAEGVAAYADQIDSLGGERLAQAAREIIDMAWDLGGAPADPGLIRDVRDEFFALLLTSQPDSALF